MGKKNKGKRNKGYLGEDDFEEARIYDADEEEDSYSRKDSRRKKDRSRRDQYDDDSFYGYDGYNSYDDSYDEDEDDEYSDYSDDDDDDEEDVDDRHDAVKSSPQVSSTPLSRNTVAPTQGQGGSVSTGYSSHFTPRGATVRHATPSSSDPMVNPDVFREQSTSSVSSQPSPLASMRPSATLKPATVTPTPIAPSASNASSPKDSSHPNVSMFRQVKPTVTPQEERAKPSIIMPASVPTRSSSTKSPAGSAEPEVDHDAFEINEQDDSEKGSRRGLFGRFGKRKDETPQEELEEVNASEEPIDEEEEERQLLIQDLEERIEKARKEYEDGLALLKDAEKNGDADDFREDVERARAQLEELEAQLEELAPGSTSKKLFNVAALGSAMTALSRNLASACSAPFKRLASLRRNRNSDEYGEDEEFDSSHDSPRSSSRSVDVEDEVHDDENYDYEPQGRNWARLAKRTIVVTIVATVVMMTLYVGKMVVSGKHNNIVPLDEETATLAQVDDTDVTETKESKPSFFKRLGNKLGFGKKGEKASDVGNEIASLNEQISDAYENVATNLSADLNNATDSALAQLDNLKEDLQDIDTQYTNPLEALNNNLTSSVNDDLLDSDAANDAVGQLVNDDAMPVHVDGYGGVTPNDAASSELLDDDPLASDDSPLTEPLAPSVDLTTPSPLVDDPLGSDDDPASIADADVNPADPDFEFGTTPVRNGATTADLTQTLTDDATALMVDDPNSNALIDPDASANVLLDPNDALVDGSASPDDPLADSTAQSLVEPLADSNDPGLESNVVAQDAASSAIGADWGDEPETVPAASTGDTTGSWGGSDWTNASPNSNDSLTTSLGSTESAPVASSALLDDDLDSFGNSSTLANEPEPNYNSLASTPNGLSTSAASPLASASNDDMTLTLGDSLGDYGDASLGSAASSDLNQLSGASVLDDRLNADNLSDLSEQAANLSSRSANSLERLSTQVNDGLNSFNQRANDAVESLTDQVDSWSTRANDTLQDFTTGVQDRVDSLAQSFDSQVDNAQNWLDQTGERLDEMANNASNSLNQSLNTLQNGYDQVANSVNDAYNNTLESLQNTGANLRNGLQERQEALANLNPWNNSAASGVDDSPLDAAPATTTPTNSLNSAPSSLGEPLASTSLANDSASTPSTLNSTSPALGTPTTSATPSTTYTTSPANSLTSNNPLSGSAAPSTSTLTSQPSTTPSSGLLGGSAANPTPATSTASNVTQPVANSQLANDLSALTPTLENSYSMSPFAQYSNNTRIAATPTASTYAASAVNTTSTPTGATSVATANPATATTSVPRTSTVGNTAPVAGSTVASAVNPATSLAGNYREYVTKEGDNLLTIAGQQLGSTSRWIEIKKLNNLPSGATYFDVGTKLKLPVAASGASN
ncbi:MAG: hypothetical protein Q4G03_03390 [Planctomycetia bacterium]|nr:hypothetical protein [Planctomycetia bacterium]